MLITKFLSYILLFFLGYSNNQDKGMIKKEKYTVVDSKDILELSEKYNGVFQQQLEFNGAVVEQLDNAAFLVIAQSAHKGLYIIDENVLHKMILSEKYPKETDSGSFYDNYKINVLELKNDNLLFFENMFLECFGYTFDYNLSNDFLIKLNYSISQFDRKYLHEECYPLLSILLNESFRKLINGQWVFDKESTLNTYNIPYIKDVFGNRVVIAKPLYTCIKGVFSIEESMITAIDHYVMDRIDVRKINLKEMYYSLNKNFEYYYKFYLSKLGNHPESFNNVYE